MWLWDDVATHTCVEGDTVWGGEGNILADPVFAREGLFDFDRYKRVRIGERERPMPDFILDPGDYRLRADSPCIDAGSCKGAPETDIDGLERPRGDSCDMGAHEHDGYEPPPLPPAPFVRGDPNRDARVDVSDAVFVLGFLFTGGVDPLCKESIDVDDTGVLDLTDAIYLLNYLFLGGAAPPGPFPNCGSDPTEYEFGCRFYDACP
jgi:hypothetical protein